MYCKIQDTADFCIPCPYLFFNSDIMKHLNFLGKLFISIMKFLFTWTALIDVVTCQILQDLI